MRKETPYEKKRREELREKILTDTYTDEAGCLRWNMGNAVPSWSFEEAGLTMTATQKAAYEESTRRSIERYRKREAARSPEEIEEHRAEARAAVGPGEKMVNVLTGERYVT